eukprot:CAMPEP_0195334924 /NCGR_PEP_ID=MMETSP0708-20121125/15175_1 /TAXON_ID=33640 /ORGANISM="Asterionellopsis glacialis, Strain CCMP134" /LENGTH=129 /DNA_ID=CAMNT_0040404991 /DNA_START=108 /DNA_END=497 /DNA_ORIENTATION=+
MNAFRPTLGRALKQVASRRYASTSAVPPLEKYKANITKDWFSDAGTYPIIMIMSCAMTFMTGMGIHALVGYKDVTLDPKKRNSVLQTWGEKEEPSVLKRAIYWNSYQKNMPEGLGVDHEKWLQAKKQGH